MKATAKKVPAPPQLERRLEYLPLSKLQPAKRNPKGHAREDIGKSIGRFGYVEPVVVDERTGRLVAGHGRVESLRVRQAAKEAPPDGVRAEGGEWLVPVLRGWASRSDTEAEAYLLASNQLVLAGGWHEAELGEMLKELDAAHALDGVGFDDAELARLLAGAGGPPLESDSPAEGEDPEGIDDVPEPPTPAETYVKPGDVYRLGAHTLVCGDSREVVAKLEAGSVSAVVTDPPYELSFMGKGWDGTGIANSVDLWRSVLASMKPGAHLLAFGGTRTYHRMTCAIEDAGAEIRDCIFWCYGQGFPKSLDVSKAIDEAAGAKRKVVGPNPNSRPNMVRVKASVLAPRVDAPLTAPATADANEWDGWGTALKPAVEPVCMARKPLEGTIAENVLKHGTGGLNIDATRIGTADDLNGGAYSKGAGTPTGAGFTIGRGLDREHVPPSGRWPANLVLDEGSAKLLDEMSGELKSGQLLSHHKRSGISKLGTFNIRDRTGEACDFGGDSGGASRFFYVAKASRSERDEGMEGEQLRVTNERDPPGTKGSNSPRAGAGRNGEVRNHHPTVKPVSLMKWLCTLATPPGGLVLEPFSGSGTTLLACERLGFTCYAVEQEPAYVQIAIARWEGLTKRKAEKVSA